MKRRASLRGNYFSTIYSGEEFSTLWSVSLRHSMISERLLSLSQLTNLIADGCDKLSEYVSFTGEQELAKSLILIMEFFESVTTNSQQMLQSEKSSTFTFCQTPIERIVSDVNTKDLFPQLMK